jgi:hypothetical protein
MTKFTLIVFNGTFVNFMLLMVNIKGTKIIKFTSRLEVLLAAIFIQLKGKIKVESNFRFGSNLSLQYVLVKVVALNL